ncbi:MAG: type VI secretion system amidase immunity protein Tai4 [Aquabacterium sp.]|nr:type VI secretion system amidase immunity protein Tai4 [Aquabacterium sp.]
MKNYALSACIAGGYRSSEVANDATAAANGYKELGSLDIDAYNEALALIKKFLDRDYASASGERMVLMKCIDLFHSKELDRLVQRYRKKRAAAK